MFLTLKLSGLYVTGRRREVVRIYFLVKVYVLFWAVAHGCHHHNRELSQTAGVVATAAMLGGKGVVNRQSIRPQANKRKRPHLSMCLPCVLSSWLTKRNVRYSNLFYTSQRFRKSVASANLSQACRVTLFIRKDSPIKIDGSPSARGVAVSSVEEAVRVLSHVCRLLEVLVCSRLFGVMYSSTRRELVAFISKLRYISSLVLLQKRM